MGMNFDQARLNMVEQQVRTWEVLDLEVLDVIGRLKREDFAPLSYRKLAYADLMIPLEHGQFMMKPVVEGRLLQALDLSGSEDVLEIGTGSGYFAACLGALAASVVTVEYYESFCQQAQRRLDGADIDNVEVVQGDAMTDWSPGRGFDAVVVTGSARVVPERFESWVKPGGRLVAVRGDSPVMEAVCLHREGSDWREESLFETDLPRLVGAEDAESFEL